ncbi:hypothetical protein QE152_g35827 [Popillia japonica]|uniref:Uncharacterized protein n=1 Tax=Popillia japonica TaxID=7064 RepID=A0AAW1IF23_POPJA
MIMIIVDQVDDDRGHTEAMSSLPVVVDYIGTTTTEDNEKETDNIWSVVVSSIFEITIIMNDDKSLLLDKILKS